MGASSSSLFFVVVATITDVDLDINTNYAPPSATTLLTPSGDSFLIVIATLSSFEMHLQSHPAHSHAAKMPAFYFRLKLGPYIFPNNTW